MPPRTPPRARATSQRVRGRDAMSRLAVGLALAAVLVLLLVLGVLPDARVLFLVAVGGGLVELVATLVRTRRSGVRDTVTLGAVALVLVAVPLVFDSRSADPFWTLKAL